MSVESIKAKLKKYSLQHRKIHQFTITRFFQERLLFRLSISKYRDHFLLKGGALVYVYGAEDSRYTKDIDLLIVRHEADHEALFSIFREISSLKVSDGVIFDTSSIDITTITKEGRYSGTRIKLKGELGNIKQYLQIDVGVGDYVTPGPQNIIYPTILSGFEAPDLLAYSIETLIAEKFEAMISLGEYNSRMKDFYDVHMFVGHGNQSVLSNAIGNTFKRRRTKLVPEHPIFTIEFYTDDKRVNQWKIFLKKNELKTIEFSEVRLRIMSYLKPIYDKIKL